MDRRSERRLAENEVIFRTFNEDAKDFVLEDTADTSLEETRLRFYCECSNLSCVERIELTAGEYDSIHSSSLYFILKPGHEVPNIERVIQRDPGYIIVEKKTEPPIPAHEIRPGDFV